MIKRLLATMVAFLLLPTLAFATPVPYVNSPLDTVQATVNAVVSNINTTQPAAAVPVQATATAGAATGNGIRVQVTSESLTTANAAAYTLTLTDASITAASQLQVTIANGTNTTAGSTLATSTPAAGSATILVYNRSGAAALNGTLVFYVMVMN